MPGEKKTKAAWEFCDKLNKHVVSQFCSLILLYLPPPPLSETEQRTWGVDFFFVHQIAIFITFWTNSFLTGGGFERRKCLPDIVVLTLSDTTTCRYGPINWPF